MRPLAVEVDRLRAAVPALLLDYPAGESVAGASQRDLVELCLPWYTRNPDDFEDLMDMLDTHTVKVAG